MTNAYPESRDEETAVISGPAPETENQLVPASLVATLTRAEIEQQLSAAHAFPRSPSHARDMMVSLATMDEQTAAECIYSVPRGGKQIRGTEHPLRGDRDELLGQRAGCGAGHDRGPD